MQIRINYLAVLVSAAVAFLLGGLWYSPLLFGRMWVKAHGYTEERVKEMRMSAPKAYVITALSLVLIGLVMSVLAGGLQLWRASQGFKLGLLVWVGFAFPLGLIANAYSDKRIGALMIDAGYQLVYLLVMGWVITIWR